MRRCDSVTSIAVGVVGALAVGASAVFAQAMPSRVEIGGQMHVLRLSESADVNVGVGGRVTVDLAPWLAVEGEYQFLPKDELDTSSLTADGRALGLRYQRRRSTALFGVKAGYRGERVGVFAKARPGFTSLTDRGVECVGEVCALVLLAVPDYRREFAFDLGGVVELYPSARWTARVDVGSLMIRHRSTAPPCAAGDCTTSNLATSLGVGMRF
jgi:hypothetical protein